MRRRLFAAALMAVGPPAVHAQVPWPERVRDSEIPSPPDYSQIQTTEWPAEPPSPDPIDAAHFASALRRLCGRLPESRARNFGRWVLESSEAFEVDPFLVGALIFQHGACRPRSRFGNGLGLTLFPLTMHAPLLRDGEYHYQVFENGAWHARTLEIGRFPMTAAHLLSPEANIYLGAALLSVFQDQHESIDQHLPQVEHRHYVSHFVWGDRVPSAREEDRILTQRRRLLEYYDAYTPPPPIVANGVTLDSPLDGGPRVVFGWIGDQRDGGDRRHRGIDIEAMAHEPVRAIANGVVRFAGIDLPGRHQYLQLERPSDWRAHERDLLGNGGRFVCILHTPEGSPALRSCYMHLDTVTVRPGQVVTRGDQIGTVGETGMEISAPHLHFEMHGPERPLDGSTVLHPLVLGRRPRAGALE